MPALAPAVGKPVLVVLAELEALVNKQEDFVVAVLKAWREEASTPAALVDFVAPAAVVAVVVDNHVIAYPKAEIHYFH